MADSDYDPETETEALTEYYREKPIPVYERLNAAAQPQTETEAESDLLSQPAGKGSGTPVLSTEKKKVKKGKKAHLIINLSWCRYDIVRECAKKYNWKEGAEGEDWHIFWTDTNQFMRLKPYQRMNHFPGMLEIARKNSLARNLNQLAKYFSEAYTFFPPTWLLPYDMSDFKNWLSKQKGPKTLIVKPEAGCQGKGIFLTRNTDDLMGKDQMIAQRYLHKPFLIDGYKFDLRLYVLVTSCDPLRIFFYKNGLARFCTEPYQEPNSNNLEQVYMHLTNYAINKEHENFVQNQDTANDDEGSKRSLNHVFERLSEAGCNTRLLWKKLQGIVIKTLISIQPNLAHTYKTHFHTSQEENDGFSCFEILGFDVLIDQRFRPWLIEVNHAPSFSCDSPLDEEIKEGVISEAIEIVSFDAKKIRKQQRQAQENTKQRIMGDSKKTTAAGEKAPADKQAQGSGQDMAAGAAKDAAVEAAEKRREMMEARQKYEDEHLDMFERIFPVETEEQEKYDKMVEAAERIFNRRFQDTAASKARKLEIERKLKEAAETEAKEKEKIRRLKEMRVRVPDTDNENRQQWEYERRHLFGPAYMSSSRRSDDIAWEYASRLKEQMARDLAGTTIPGAAQANQAAPVAQTYEVVNVNGHLVPYMAGSALALQQSFVVPTSIQHPLPLVTYIPQTHSIVSGRKIDDADINHATDFRRSGQSLPKARSLPRDTGHQYKTSMDTVEPEPRVGERVRSFQHSDRHGRRSGHERDAADTMAGERPRSANASGGALDDVAQRRAPTDSAPPMGMSVRGKDAGLVNRNTVAGVMRSRGVKMPPGKYWSPIDVRAVAPKQRIRTEQSMQAAARGDSKEMNEGASSSGEPGSQAPRLATVTYGGGGGAGGAALTVGVDPNRARPGDRLTRPLPRLHPRR